MNFNQNESEQKILKFNKVHTHRRSGLLISKFALEKLFRYLMNCAGVTLQNLVSPKSRFMSHSHAIPYQSVSRKYGNWLKIINKNSLKILTKNARM